MAFWGNIPERRGQDGILEGIPFGTRMAITLSNNDAFWVTYQGREGSYALFTLPVSPGLVSVDISDIVQVLIPSRR